MAMPAVVRLSRGGHPAADAYDAGPPGLPLLAGRTARAGRAGLPVLVLVVGRVAFDGPSRRTPGGTPWSCSRPPPRSRSARSSRRSPHARIGTTIGTIVFFPACSPPASTTRSRPCWAAAHRGRLTPLGAATQALYEAAVGGAPSWSTSPCWRSGSSSATAGRRPGLPLGVRWGPAARSCRSSEEQWLTRLPFLVLAWPPSSPWRRGPHRGRGGRRRLTLALVVLTAVWMLATPGPGRVYYVGRTVLALVLTLLNPLFSDLRVWWATRRLRLPAAPVGLVAMLAVGITMARAERGASDAMTRRRRWCWSPCSRSTSRSPGSRRISVRSEQRRSSSSRSTPTWSRRWPRTGAAGDRRRAGPAGRRPAGAARLAREIHDTIAQSLAGVVAQLQAATRTASGDDRARRWPGRRSRRRGARCWTSRPRS